MSLLLFGYIGICQQFALIFSLRLEKGHKIVLETPEGKLFIHEARKFGTLEDLLAHYSANCTKCGVFLKTQLTKSQFNKALPMCSISGIGEI